MASQDYPVSSDSLAPSAVHAPSRPEEGRVAPLSEVLESLFVTAPAPWPFRPEAALYPLTKAGGKPRAARLMAILEGLSQISHELRHSLALIRGASQLLMELDKDEGHYYAAVVNEEAVHLSRLMEDLLDLSRLELGTFKLLPSWVDLASLVREAANTTALLSDKHAVRVYLPKEVPPVYADATRIHQVLVNLLTNALKYSPEGSTVTISVSVDRSAQRVYVSVSDEGPGIADEAMPFIFEPFYRGSEASSRVDGVGLGLAISKGIVEAHGGQIGVNSRQGEGSTFFFYLPCKAESAV